jgi:hypothetical protein
LRSASRASVWAALASFFAASLAARSWADRERVERFAVTASVVVEVVSGGYLEQ